MRTTTNTRNKGRNKFLKMMAGATLLTILFVVVFSGVLASSFAIQQNAINNGLIDANVADAAGITTSTTTTTITDASNDIVFGTYYSMGANAGTSNWSLALKSGSANTTASDKTDTKYFYEAQAIANNSNIQGTTSSKRYGPLGGGDVSKTNFSSSSGFNYKAPEKLVGIHAQSDSNTCSATLVLYRKIVIPSSVKTFYIKFDMYAATDGYSTGSNNHYVQMKAGLFDSSFSYSSYSISNAIDSKTQTATASISSSDPATDKKTFEKQYSNSASGDTDYYIAVFCEFYKKDASGYYDVADQLALLGDISIKVATGTYTVTLAPDGGTNVTSSPVTMTYGTATSISPATKTGYTFSRWNLTSTNAYTTAKYGNTSSASTTISDSSTDCYNTSNRPTGAVYFKDLTNRLGGSATLTARWTQNKGTITYDGNGATGGTVPSNQDYYWEDSSFTVSTNILSRAGYIFRGWSLDSGTNDTAGTFYKPGDSFSKTQNSGTNYFDISPANTTAHSVTLYAVWTPIRFTLGGTTYDPAATQSFSLLSTKANSAYVIPVNFERNSGETDRLTGDGTSITDGTAIVGGSNDTTKYYGIIRFGATSGSCTSTTRPTYVADATNVYYAKLSIYKGSVSDANKRGEVVFSFEITPGDFGTKSGGTGTWGEATNPYMIYTEAQLLTLMRIVNGISSAQNSIRGGSNNIANDEARADDRTYANCFFELGADLTMTNANGMSEFGPIGISSTYYFAGTFKGCGKKVILEISTDATEYVGLFGYISGATIQGVAIDGEVGGTKSGSNLYVGGIAGYAVDSSIKNCYNHASVSASTATNRYVGGIVGQLTKSSGTASLQYDANEGSVSGGTKTGTILGNATGSTPTMGYCYTTVGTNLWGNGTVNGATNWVISTSAGTNNYSKRLSTTLTVYPYTGTTELTKEVNSSTVADWSKITTNDVTGFTVTSTNVTNGYYFASGNTSGGINLKPSSVLSHLGTEDSTVKVYYQAGISLGTNKKDLYVSVEQFSVTDGEASFTYSGSAQGPSVTTSGTTQYSKTESYSGTEDYGDSYPASGTKPTNAGTYTYVCEFVCNVSGNKIMGRYTRANYTIGKRTLNVSYTWSDFSAVASTPTITSSEGNYTIGRTNVTVGNASYNGFVFNGANQGLHLITISNFPSSVTGTFTSSGYTNSANSATYNVFNTSGNFVAINYNSNAYTYTISFSNAAHANYVLKDSTGATEFGTQLTFAYKIRQLDFANENDLALVTFDYAGGTGVGNSGTASLNSYYLNNIHNSSTTASCYTLVNIFPTDLTQNTTSTAYGDAYAQHNLNPVLIYSKSSNYSSFASNIYIRIRNIADDSTVGFKVGANFNAPATVPSLSEDMPILPNARVAITGSSNCKGTFTVFYKLMQSDFGGNFTQDNWGSQSNPFVISDLSHLIRLSNIVNSGNNATAWNSIYNSGDAGTHHVYHDNSDSTKDIDDYTYENGYFVLGDNLTAYWLGGFKPIGNASYAFAGTFDGQSQNDYTITLQLEGTNKSVLTIDYVGLFGHTNGATIKDLHVTSGTNDGTTHIVSGDDYVGGIVGWAQNTTFNNVYSEVRIKATGDYVGGIVGKGENSTIVNSKYNKGLTVSNNAKATVLAASTVIGRNYVGGLAGALTGTSNISGTTSFNGHVFSTDDLTSSTVGGSYVGGYVGYFDTTAVINLTPVLRNNISVDDDADNATIHIVGKSYVGGVFGFIKGGNGSKVIINTTSNHNNIYLCVIGYGAGEVVGGFAGYMNNVKIVLSCDMDTKRLFHYYDGSSAASTFANFSSTVSNYWGGMVGILGKGATITSEGSGNTQSNHTLTNSASTISVGTYVGGIVGYISTQAGEAVGSSNTNVFGNHLVLHNIGEIDATGDYVGGLVGYIGMSATLPTTPAHSTLFATDVAAGGKTIVFGPTYNNGAGKAINAGSIESDGSYVGGLVGYVCYSDDENSLVGARVEFANDVLDKDTDLTLANLVVGTVSLNAAKNALGTAAEPTIRGAGYVGGMVGYLKGNQNNSVISYAIVVAAAGSESGIYSTGDYVGGIVGRMDNGTISNSMFGSLKLQGNNNNTIYSTTRIDGDDYVGGIAGYVANGYVRDCISLGFHYSKYNLSKNRTGVVGAAGDGVQVNAWAIYFVANNTYSNKIDESRGYGIILDDNTDTLMIPTYFEVAQMIGLIKNDDTAKGLTQSGSRNVTNATNIAGANNYISIAFKLYTDTQNKQYVFYDASGTQTLYDLSTYANGYHTNYQQANEEDYYPATKPVVGISANEIVYLRLSKDVPSLSICAEDIEFKNIPTFDSSNPPSGVTALTNLDSAYRAPQGDSDHYYSVATSANYANATPKYFTSGQAVIMFYLGAGCNIKVGYFKKDSYTYGTDAPYPISSLEDWKSFATKINNTTGDTIIDASTNKQYRQASFVLTKDIDLGDLYVSGTSYLAGNSTKNFQGVFDGNGHKLTFTYTNTTVAEGASLFPYAGNAIFKNLTLDGSVNLVSAAQTTWTVGSTSYTTYKVSTGSAANNNCKNNPWNVSTSYKNVAGFVGTPTGNVIFTNCTNSVNVFGSTNAGGFVGLVSSGHTVTIIDCVNEGTIQTYTAAGQFTKGGAGDNTIPDDHASVNFDGGTGGFIGNIKGATVIDSCRNMGEVRAPQNVGGVVGRTTASITNIYNCANTGNIIGDSGYDKESETIKDAEDQAGSSQYLNYVGGIVGKTSGSTARLGLYASYNKGVVTAYGSVAGGLVGSIGDLKPCDRELAGNSGNFDGTTARGNSVISYCFNAGVVQTGGTRKKYMEGWMIMGTTRLLGTIAGGIVGVFGCGTISYCYNTAEVISHGGDGYSWEWHVRVGGIVAQAQPVGGYARIHHCYNTGLIKHTADDYTGFTLGIGWGDDAIKNGGCILGYIDDHNETEVKPYVSVTYCYSTPKSFYRAKAGNTSHYSDVGLSTGSGGAVASSGVICSLADMTALMRSDGIIAPNGKWINGGAVSGFGSSAGYQTIYSSATTLVDAAGNSIKNTTNEFAPEYSQEFMEGSLNGWIYIYGCLPQLAVFALGTKNGTSMLSTNYGLNADGDYVAEQAGDKYSPYTIKDGLHLMSMTALTSAYYSFENVYVETAYYDATTKKTNNIDKVTVKGINMPTGNSPQTNDYKGMTSETGGTYVQSKTYFLLTDGALYKGDIVRGDTGATSSVLDAWKAKNYYSNGSNWTTTTGFNPSTANFYPIGSMGTTVFKGNFDGKGLVINNLKMQMHDDNLALGIFGKTQGATIKNLKAFGVINGYTTGTDSSKTIAVGGIVGRASANTTIDGCSAGFGNRRLDVKALQSDGNINPNGYVGGIVGLSDDSGYIEGTYRIVDSRYVAINGDYDGQRYQQSTNADGLGIYKYVDGKYILISTGASVAYSLFQDPGGGTLKRLDSSEYDTSTYGSRAYGDILQYYTGTRYSFTAVEEGPYKYDSESKQYIKIYEATSYDMESGVGEYFSGRYTPEDGGRYYRHVSGLEYLGTKYQESENANGLYRYDSSSDRYYRMTYGFDEAMFTISESGSGLYEKYGSYDFRFISILDNFGVNKYSAAESEYGIFSYSNNIYYKIYDGTSYDISLNDAGNLRLEGTYVPIVGDATGERFLVSQSNTGLYKQVNTYVTAPSNYDGAKYAVATAANGAYKLSNGVYVSAENGYSGTKYSITPSNSGTLMCLTGYAVAENGYSGTKYSIMLDGTETTIANSNSKIINCEIVDSTIETFKSGAGGIVGHIKGAANDKVTIENCYVTKATIQAKTNNSSGDTDLGTNIGGVIGSTSDISPILYIKNVHVGGYDKVNKVGQAYTSTKNVTIKGENTIGGIIGRAPLIMFVKNTGVWGDVRIERVQYGTQATNVTDTIGTAIGGLVGYTQVSDSAEIEFRGKLDFAGEIKVSAATTSGVVTNIGGLVGYIGKNTKFEQQDTTIINISGVIDTADYSSSDIGGVVGSVNNADFYGTFTSTAAITTSNATNVGGFIGSATGTCEILAGSKSTDKVSVTIGGNIKAKSNVGGFIGLVGTNAMLGIGQEVATGGISSLGTLDITIISSSVIEAATVTIQNETSGGTFVGGIIGKGSGELAIGTRASIDNQGLVKGVSYVGGVVGFMAKGTLSGTLSNSGAVRGDNYVGGVIGVLAANAVGAKLLNYGAVSSPSTDVSSKTAIGGAIGYIGVPTELDDETTERDVQTAAYIEEHPSETEYEYHIKYQNNHAEYSEGSGYLTISTADFNALYGTTGSVSLGTSIPNDKTGLLMEYSVWASDGTYALIDYAASVDSYYSGWSGTKYSYNGSSFGPSNSGKYLMLNNDHPVATYKPTFNEYNKLYGSKGTIVQGTDFTYHQSGIHYDISDTELVFSAVYDGNRYVLIDYASPGWSGTKYKYQNGAFVEDADGKYMTLSLKTVGGGSGDGGVGGVIGIVGEDIDWNENNSFYIAGDVMAVATTSNGTNAMTNVGGTIGLIKSNNITIKNLLAYDTWVEGGSNVGGVIGAVTGANVTIKNSFNVTVSDGKGVKVASNAGGIIGLAQSTTNANTCYWVKGYSNSEISSLSLDEFSEHLGQYKAVEITMGGVAVVLTKETFAQFDTPEEYADAFEITLTNAEKTNQGNWQAFLTAKKPNGYTVEPITETDENEVPIYTYYVFSLTGFTAYTTGRESTGWYFVYANNAGYTVNTKYDANDPDNDLEYWRYISNNYSEGKSRATSPIGASGIIAKETATPYVYDYAGGGTLQANPNKMYATAGAPSVDDYYLYIAASGRDNQDKERGLRRIPTESSDTLKMFVEVDFSEDFCAQNVAIFYRNVTAGSIVYNGCQRYAPLSAPDDTNAAEGGIKYISVMANDGIDSEHTHVDDVTTLYNAYVYTAETTGTPVNPGAYSSDISIYYLFDPAPVYTDGMTDEQKAAQDDLAAAQRKYYRVGGNNSMAWYITKREVTVSIVADQSAEYAKDGSYLGGNAKPGNQTANTIVVEISGIVANDTSSSSFAGFTFTLNNLEYAGAAQTTPDDFNVGTFFTSSNTPADSKLGMHCENAVYVSWGASTSFSNFNSSTTSAVESYNDISEEGHMLQSNTNNANRKREVIYRFVFHYKNVGDNSYSITVEFNDDGSNANNITTERYDPLTINDEHGTLTIAKKTLTVSVVSDTVVYNGANRSKAVTISGWNNYSNEIQTTLTNLGISILADMPSDTSDVQTDVINFSSLPTTPYSVTATFGANTVLNIGKLKDVAVYYLVFNGLEYKNYEISTSTPSPGWSDGSNGSKMLQLMSISQNTMTVSIGQNGSSKSHVYNGQYGSLKMTVSFTETPDSTTIHDIVENLVSVDGLDLPDGNGPYVYYTSSTDADSYTMTISETDPTEANRQYKNNMAVVISNASDTYTISKKQIRVTVTNGGSNNYTGYAQNPAVSLEAINDTSNAISQDGDTASFTFANLSWSVSLSFEDEGENTVSKIVNVGTYYVQGTGAKVKDSNGSNSSNFTVSVSKDASCSYTITQCSITNNVVWTHAEESTPVGYYVYSGSAKSPWASRITLGTTNKTRSNSSSNFAGLHTNEVVTITVALKTSGGDPTSSIDVGDYKAVITGVSITGSNAAGSVEGKNNYDTSGIIGTECVYHIYPTVITLSLTSSERITKVYNGNTNLPATPELTCSLTRQTTGGATPSTSIITLSNAAYNSPNVGNRTITCTATISGNNFAFSYTVGQDVYSGTTSGTYSYTNAEITPKLVSIVLNTNNNSAYKTYDASTAYALWKKGDTYSDVYVLGQGMTASGLIETDDPNAVENTFAVRAVFAEAGAGRSGLDAYANDIVIEGSNYSFNQDTQHPNLKKLVFTIGSYSESTFTAASAINNYVNNYKFMVYSGTNTSENELLSAETTALSFDVLDTSASHGLSIEILRRTVDVRFGNTKQSYVKADNTFKTEASDWLNVNATTASFVAGDSVSFELVNNWKYVNGDSSQGVMVYKKHTVIHGAEDSNLLGAKIITNASEVVDKARVLNYVLRNQPTLTIGYFVSASDTYDVDTISGLMLATYYYSKGFDSADNNIGATLYENQWFTMATNAAYASGSGYDSVSTSGWPFEWNTYDTPTSWDDLFSKFQTAFNANASNADNQIQIIFDVTQGTAGEWGFWAKVSLGKTSYDKFQQKNNISGVLTESDIAVLEGLADANGNGTVTAAEWSACFPNFLQLSAGSVVVAIGSIFRDQSYTAANSSIVSVPFIGSYNGNGFTIENINIMAYATSSSAATYNIGMFESVGSGKYKAADTTDKHGVVTGVNLRNWNISFNDGNNVANTINVGGIIGYSEQTTKMSNSSFHGLINVQSNGGTVNVGGIIGNFNDGGVATHQVIDGAICVGTIYVDGKNVNAGGIVGKFDTASGFTINNVVSLTSIFARIADAEDNTTHNYVGGLVGCSTQESVGILTTTTASGGETQKVNAYLENSANNMNEESAIGRQIGNVSSIATGYGGVSYETLMSGSTSGYVGGKYQSSNNTNAYDMVETPCETTNVIESHRLVDIVDIYVFLYGKGTALGTGDFAAVNVFTKSATSWLVGSKHGKDANGDRFAINNQQQVAYLREFRFATFVIANNINMYTAHDKDVFAGAFYGNVTGAGNINTVNGSQMFELELSGHEVPIAS